MFVFWWSGRGYLTFLIVLGGLAGFGLVQRAFDVADGSWIWGSALLVAATVNWHFGSKANRKKLLALKPAATRDRLFYRARHRFMSLPMETFSLVIAAVGLILLAAALFRSVLNII